MADPRLIVFDMDGTLIDSGAIIAEHMAATFTEQGWPRRRAHQYGDRADARHRHARLADCDTDTALALAETYRRLYRAMLETEGRHEPLYAGAADALARLRGMETSLLGIATGKALHGANRILALHGLSDHFITVQTPDHNPSKPHPGMMLRACAETGIDPSRAVMIGDTTFDMELGVAAGAKTIGVTWGYHERALLDAAGADIIIEDYADLDAAIEEVLA